MISKKVIQYKFLIHMNAPDNEDFINHLKRPPAAAETVFSTDTYVDRLYSPESAEQGRTVGVVVNGS